MVVLVALIAVVAVAATLYAFLHHATVTYAAVVNGVEIRQSQLHQELTDIESNAKYVQLIDEPGGSGPVAGDKPGTFNLVFEDTVLNQEVRSEVIRQALVTRHALPTAAQVAAADSQVSQTFPSGIFAAFPARYRQTLAMLQANSNAFVTVETAAVTATEASQYYQEHSSDYATEACVRQILIADKDATGQVDAAASLADANKIKSMLDAGGNFAALAMQYSQDNGTGGSAAQGGMLSGSAPDGCLTTADLQQLATTEPSVASAVISLPVNQVSNPVQTDVGYDLVELTKRVIEPLDSSVTANIHQRLAGVALDQLLANGAIKINPSFGTFDRSSDASGDVIGVVPPAGTASSSTTTPGG